MYKAKTNLSLLWLSGVFSAILAFFTQTIIARNLDLYDYGIFSTSLAAAVLVAPIAGFGACKLLLRIFGENDSLGKAKYSKILEYIFVSSFCAYMVFLASTIISNDNTWWTLILGFHIFGLLAVDLITTNSQITNNMVKVSVWQLIPNFIRCSLVVLFAYVMELSVLSVVFVYFIAALVSVGFAFVDVRGFVNKTIGTVEEKLNLIGTYSVANVFKESWPFGLASLVHLVIYQSDIVLLGYLDKKEVAGLYNTSFLILTAVYLLPAIAYQKLYLPLVHRWSFHDRNMLLLFFKRSIKLMLVSGVLVNLVLYYSSGFLINGAFGENYAEASDMLKLLSFSVPFMFVVYCCGPILTTKNNIKKKINIMIVVASINVMLNIFLIPVYSYVGACVSTIICSAILACLYYFESARVVGDESLVN